MRRLINPFVVSLSNHGRNLLMVRALRQAQRERLINESCGTQH